MFHNVCMEIHGFSRVSRLSAADLVLVLVHEQLHEAQPDRHAEEDVHEREDAVVAVVRRAVVPCAQRQWALRIACGDVPVTL